MPLRCASPERPTRHRCLTSATNAPRLGIHRLAIRSRNTTLSDIAGSSPTILTEPSTTPESPYGPSPSGAAEITTRATPDRWTPFAGGTLVTAYNGSYGPVPLIERRTLVRGDNVRVAHIGDSIGAYTSNYACYRRPISFIPHNVRTNLYFMLF